MIEHVTLYDRWVYPAFFAIAGGVVRQIIGRKEAESIETHVPRLRFWVGEFVVSLFAGLVVHEAVSYWDVPLGAHNPISGMAGYCNREVLSTLPSLFEWSKGLLLGRIGMKEKGK